MNRLARLLNTNDNLVDNCLDEPYENDVQRYENWDFWASRILENIIEIDKLGG